MLTVLVTGPTVTQNSPFIMTAPVLTFLFTGRDAAITVNSVKLDITQ